MIVSDDAHDFGVHACFVARIVRNTLMQDRTAGMEAAYLGTRSLKVTAPSPAFARARALQNGGIQCVIQTNSNSLRAENRTFHGLLSASFQHRQLPVGPDLRSAHSQTLSKPFESLLQSICCCLQTHLGSSIVCQLKIPGTAAALQGSPASLILHHSPF